MRTRMRVLTWLATWAIFLVVAPRLLEPRQLIVLPAALFTPLGVASAPLWIVAGWLAYVAQAVLALTRKTRRSFWLWWAVLPLLLGYNVAAFAIRALAGLR